MILLLLTAICFAFSVVIYFLWFFDGKGAAATFVLSTVIIMLSPPWWFFSVVVGYIMIICVTAYQKDEKAHIRGTRFKDDKKRTYTNVLGKVATPVIAAAIGDVGMFVSSISFGVADSAANEIGILSRKRPVLITTGKSADPGTNGAVSLLGTSAGCIASTVLGIVFSIIGFSSLLKPQILFLALVTGILGNLVDSCLGSAIENRGFLKGWQVNLLSSLVSGVIGSLIYSILL